MTAHAADPALLDNDSSATADLATLAAADALDGVLDDPGDANLYAQTRVSPPPNVPRSAEALVPVPPGMDWVLLSVVVGLMTAGTVMAFSASIFVALHQHNGDESYFLTRHLAHVVTALVVLFVGAHIPYQFWRKVAYPMLVVSIVLLCSLFVFGHTRNNATRWLIIGGVPFQPAELAKFTFAVYLAYSLEKKLASDSVRSFSVGFLPHALVWCLVFALCMKQPDLGTGIVLAVMLFAMTFIAGTNLAYLVFLVFCGVFGLATFIIHDPMRSRRLWAFLEPLTYRDSTGFQLFNGKLAVATGGLFGNGLGMSRQKLGFVPEAHTDFILSILAEELGLIGVLLVALAFLMLLQRGLRIALRARDEFGRLLAGGITVLLGTQAAVNFGVVMGTLPTKGLTLPFVSHGGSSMVVLALAVGVLINIGRGGNPGFSVPNMGFGGRWQRLRVGRTENVRTGNTRIHPAPQGHTP